MNKLLTVTVAMLFAIGMSTYAQSASDNLHIDDMFELSLEELMNLEVKVGSISGTSSKKLPLSVTTITKEQIELSNAQNLLHLIQMYVPGASYWDHVEGQMVALRGITSSRNNKLLLSVNGLILNQKAHTGVASELDDWDMQDISKVEIIRGPGSVTYGPGAIAGVINIVTKNAGEEIGLKVNAKYTSQYNNKTISASYGFKDEAISGYFHASVASTDGYTPDGYLMEKDTIGARGVSNSSNSKFIAPAMNIGRNMNKTPDMKFLATLNFLKENTFTARYTRTNATTHGYFLNQSQKVVEYGAGGEAIRGDYDDFAMADRQQLTVSLKNNHSFGDLGLDLETELAFIGSDYMRSNNATNNYDQETYETLSKRFDVNSFDYVRNLRQNFSENSLMGRSMGVYKINDKNRIAAGAEIVSTLYGKGWGDNADNFVMKDGNTFIVSNNNSNALSADGKYNSIDTTTLVAGQDYFMVGDGWRTTDVGFVAEANLSFAPMFNLMLSARLDKNTYSKWVFSPRIAVISELNENNLLKLILQQSKRVNSAEQLYIGNAIKESGDVEAIFNAEMIYTKMIGDNSMLNISAFYNNQDAIGFDIAQKETRKIAKVETAGLEIDYRMQSDKRQGGISHAYNKTISYKLHNGVEKTLISYADYKYNNGIGKTVNIGYGNDLRDISNHSSKLYFDEFFKEKKYIFHTELAVIWGYQGNKDAQGVATKAELSQEKAIEIYDLYEQAFNEYDFFDTSIFWNATFTAKLFDNFSINAGIQNILGGSNSKIYGLTGNLKRASYRIIPRTYTLKLTYKL